MSVYVLRLFVFQFLTYSTYVIVADNEQGAGK